MSRITTMTVCLKGPLSDFVAANVGENSAYDNVSEYVRDLIRRDKERVEAEAFERLKAELTNAFAAPAVFIHITDCRRYHRTPQGLTVWLMFAYRKPPLIV